MNIYDVAKQCGVSIATVSRVLNENPNVNAQTRARVLEVIRELGYTPNVFARGLGLNSMKMIGIMCTDVSDPYYAKAVSLTEQLLRAREAGCWFSINPRGIATGRGREYAKLVPANRMLLESDCPEEGDGRFRAAQLSELLEQDLRAVEQAVGHPVAAQVLENSLELLGSLGQRAVSRR